MRTKSMHRLRPVTSQKGRRLTPEERLVAAENKRARIGSLTYVERLMRISPVCRWGRFTPYTTV